MKKFNKKFTVNGKEYNAKTFSINVMCDFDEMGIDITNAFDNKPIQLVRAYISVCGNMSLEEAGEELEAHLYDGGDFVAITELIGEALEESGFFRQNSKMEKEETPKSKSKAKSKE